MRHDRNRGETKPRWPRPPTRFGSARSESRAGIHVPAERAFVVRLGTEPFRTARAASTRRRLAARPILHPAFLIRDRLPLCVADAGPEYTVCTGHSDSIRGNPMTSSGTNMELATL